MEKTLYMLNSRVERETPLFTFTTNEELSSYVHWRLSCSSREYHAMMNAFLKGLTFSEEFHPNIQYEIRNGK